MVNTQYTPRTVLSEIEIIDIADTIQDMKSDLSNLSRLTRDVMGRIFGTRPDIDRAEWLCEFLAGQFEAQSDAADALLNSLVCPEGGAE